jgi:hypothetical protein
MNILFFTDDRKEKKEKFMNIFEFEDISLFELNHRSFMNHTSTKNKRNGYSKYGKYDNIFNRIHLNLFKESQDKLIFILHCFPVCPVCPRFF